MGLGLGLGLKFNPTQPINGLVLTEKSHGTTSRINVLSFVQALVKCDEIEQ